MYTKTIYPGTKTVPIIKSESPNTHLQNKTKYNIDFAIT